MAQRSPVVSNANREGRLYRAPADGPNRDSLSYISFEICSSYATAGKKVEINIRPHEIIHQPACSIFQKDIRCFHMRCWSRKWWKVMHERGILDTMSSHDSTRFIMPQQPCSALVSIIVRLIGAEYAAPRSISIFRGALPCARNMTMPKSVRSPNVS